MINVAGKFSGDSARYMMAQQRELAKEEGFIEEMMAGQKVVKVFVHEQKSIEEFDEINKSLFKASERANKAGNSIMPVLANIGNFLYVIVAIFGAVMVFNNVFCDFFKSAHAPDTPTRSRLIINAKLCKAL